MKIYRVWLIGLVCLCVSPLLSVAQEPNVPRESSEPDTAVVCHDGQTMFIDDSDLQMHLDHGDTQGTCPGAGGVSSGSSGGDSNDENGEKPEKVTICHKGRNTLNIAKSALQAHLDHGDTQGTCPDSEKNEGTLAGPEAKSSNPQSSEDKGNAGEDNENETGNGRKNDSQETDNQHKGHQGKGHQGDGKGK